MIQFLNKFKLLGIILIFGCNPLEYQFDENEKNLKPPVASDLIINTETTGDTIIAVGESQLFFQFKTDNQKIELVEVLVDSMNKFGVGYSPNSSSVYIYSNVLTEGYHTLNFNIYTTSGSNSLADRLGSEGFKYSFTKKLLFVEKKPKQIKNINFLVDNGYLKLSWTPNNYDRYRKVSYKLYQKFENNSEQFVKAFSGSIDTTFTDPGYIGGGVSYRIETYVNTESVSSEVFNFNDQLELEIELTRDPNNDIRIKFPDNPYKAVAYYKVQKQVNGFGPEEINFSKFDTNGNPLDLKEIVLDSKFYGYGGEESYRILYVSPTTIFPSKSKITSIGFKIPQFSGIKGFHYLQSTQQYVISGKNTIVINASDYSFVKKIDGLIIYSQSGNYAIKADMQDYINGGLQINSIYTQVDPLNFAPISAPFDVSSKYGKSIYSFGIQLSDYNEIIAHYYFLNGGGSDYETTLFSKIDSNKITKSDRWENAIFSSDGKYMIFFQDLFKLNSDSQTKIGSTEYAAYFMEGTPFLYDYNFENSLLRINDQSNLALIKSFHIVNLSSYPLLYDEATGNFGGVNDEYFYLIDGNTGNVIKTIRISGSASKLHNNNLFLGNGYVIKL